jgi:hypothetical protein
VITEDVVVWPSRVRRAVMRGDVVVVYGLVEGLVGLIGTVGLVGSMGLWVWRRPRAVRWRARATDDCRAFVAGHGTPLGVSILGATRPAGGDGRAEMGGPQCVIDRVPN